MKTHTCSYAIAYSLTWFLKFSADLNFYSYNINRFWNWDFKKFISLKQSLQVAQGFKVLIKTAMMHYTELFYTLLFALWDRFRFQVRPKFAIICKISIFYQNLKAQEYIYEVFISLILHCLFNFVFEETSYSVNTCNSVLS